MKKMKAFLLLIITISNFFSCWASNLKLTRLKCNETDKAFAKFEKCRIKAESRDLQYFTVYVKLLQLPVEDMQIRFRFLKRANGYKPFLYDFTFGCDFVKHLNPVSKIVYNWLKDATNLNHSCPLTEDIIMTRLENRYLQKQLSVLPLPGGDYAFFVDFKSLNELKFTVEFYATID